MNLQRRGDAADVDQRRVSLAALDSADVRAVESAPIGKLLLGDTEPPAQLAHPVAEQETKVIWHPVMFFI